uniref:Uncharacterized protein n=1 Tax=Anguilla anguilla TaxID=7936 RepID=A0A0E9WVQ8_ANGAN
MTLPVLSRCVMTSPSPHPRWTRLPVRSRRVTAGIMKKHRGSPNICSHVKCQHFPEFLAFWDVRRQSVVRSTTV